MTQGIFRKIVQTLTIAGCFASPCLWSGCRVSSTAPEVSATQELATTSEPDKTLDPGAILTAHTAALQSFQASFDNIKGLDPVYTECLDPQSSIQESWIKAMSSRTDASWFLYALRLAQSNTDNLPEAIRIIDMVKSHHRDYDIDDILDFHRGRMWQALAVNQDGEEAKSAWQHALDDFSSVQKYRQSPYYHLARAEKIRVEIELGIPIADEISAFIQTYPDYPGLKDFRLALASEQFNSGKSDLAIQSIQDLAWSYPWSAVSFKAAKWLEERNLGQREHSFEEDFARVESLRKARFWDDAEKAAAEATAKYPESYQLMVQHARIAYERSDHEEAVRRFEAILEKLDGETKDRLKPSGVIAYIYRAYGYAGNCTKALEYHALNASRLGKKDRAKSTMEFALSCGALDTAFENARIVFENATSGNDLYQLGLLAYLNEDYESARLHFSQALDDLSGTAKRRVQYFIAQATLKSARQKEKADDTQAASLITESQVPMLAADNSGRLRIERLTLKDAGKNAKNSKSSKKTKSSKSSKSSKKTTALAPATIERAQSLFESLIASDSGDYYAILAYSRLAELNRKTEDAAPATPAHQTFGNTSQNPEPPRPWSMEFTYDEKAPLKTLRNDVEKFKDAVPELERVLFLHESELYLERNALFRALTIEIMGITRQARRPSLASLWTSKLSIDGHLVDNRKNDKGYWGCELKDYYFELPGKKETEARKAIAERQGRIYDQGQALRSFIQNTLPAFHEYYLARRYTPAQKQTCGSQKNLTQCSTLYPHAYSNSVISAARDNQITPDLIWALMNIESAFNPDSISHSDAYGLLQIIPMTGYKIADAMSKPDFGPYDLIQPANSIAMGTWYFAQILHKFHGNASLSMAAYNGGPHQVARWLTAYAGKMEQDAFIELIPYDEARNYVKKGMTRLLVFHRIDEHNPDYFFEIPNQLPESFEAMPNY